MELPASPSVDQVEAFIQQFVRDERVTAHYRWTGPRSQVLEGKAALQTPPILLHTTLLKDKIRQYVSGMLAEEQQQQESNVDAVVT